MSTLALKRFGEFYNSPLHVVDALQYALSGGRYGQPGNSSSVPIYTERVPDDLTLTVPIGSSGVFVVSRPDATNPKHVTTLYVDPSSYEAIASNPTLFAVYGNASPGPLPREIGFRRGYPVENFYDSGRCVGLQTEIRPLVQRGGGNIIQGEVVLVTGTRILRPTLNQKAQLQQVVPADSFSSADLYSPNRVLYAGGGEPRVFSGGSVDTAPMFVVTRKGEWIAPPEGGAQEIFALTADVVEANGSFVAGSIPQFYQDSFEIYASIQPLINTQPSNSVATYRAIFNAYWACVDDGGSVVIRTTTTDVYAEVTNPTNSSTLRFATTCKVVRFAPPSNTPGGNYVLLGLRSQIIAPATPNQTQIEYEFLVKFPNRDPNQENTTLITSIQGYYQGPVSIEASQIWAGVPTDATLLQKSGAVVRPSGSTQRDLVNEAIGSSMGSLGTSRILTGPQVNEWDSAVANPTSMASLITAQPGSMSAGLRDLIATGEYKAAGFGDFLKFGQGLARAAAPVLSAINPMYGGIASAIGGAPLSASGVYRARGMRGRYNAAGHTVMLRKPRVGGFGKAGTNLINAQYIGSPQELLNVNRCKMAGQRLTDIMPSLGRQYASGNPKDAEESLNDILEGMDIPSAPSRTLRPIRTTEYKTQTSEVSEDEEEPESSDYEEEGDEERDHSRDVEPLNEKEFLTDPTTAPSDETFRQAMGMASTGYAIHPYMVGLGPFVSGNALAIASNMGNPDRQIVLSSQTFPAVSEAGVALISLVISSTAMDTPADMPGFAELLVQAGQDESRLTPQQIAQFRYHEGVMILSMPSQVQTLADLRGSADASAYQKFIQEFGAYRLFVDKAIRADTAAEVAGVFQEYVHLMPRRTDRIRDIYITLDAFENVLEADVVSGPSLQVALLGAMAGGPTGLIMTGEVGPQGKIKAIKNVKDKTQSFEAPSDPDTPVRPMIVIPLDNASEYEAEFAQQLVDNYYKLDYRGMMKLRVICIDNIKDLFWVLQGPVYRQYVKEIDPKQHLLKTASRWREAYNAAIVMYTLQSQMENLEQMIEDGVNNKGMKLSDSEIDNMKNQFNKMFPALEEKRSKIQTWERKTAAAEDLSGIDELNKKFVEVLEEVTKSKGMKYFLAVNPRGGKPIRQSNINLKYSYPDGSPVTGKVNKAAFRDKMVKSDYEPEDRKAYKFRVTIKNKKRREEENNAPPGAKLPKLTQGDLITKDLTFYIPKVYDNQDAIGKEGRKKMNQAKVMRKFVTYETGPPKPRKRNDAESLMDRL